MADLPSLDDAWTKLRWAEHHFGPLHHDLRAIEQAHTHRVGLDVEPQTGEYIFRVFDLPVLSPDIGLRIGDVLHNARAALDYLATQLVALKTGQDPLTIEGVQFPLYSDRGRYQSAISNFGGNKKPAHELLHHGHLTRIEELQPFHASDPSIWGFGPGGLTDPLTGGIATRATLPAMLPNALRALGDLDNIDKHRTVHPVWHTAACNVDPVEAAPAEFRLVEATWTSAPLENGAELSRWRFEPPLPAHWRPTEMEMNGYLSLHVGFGNPRGQQPIVPFASPAIGVLATCIWGARAVLAIFEPVFTHGDPPRPLSWLAGRWT